MGENAKVVRVLFVVRSLHVGGMEQMVIELATSVQAAGYHVRFCAIEDPGQLADQLATAGIKLDALNKPPGLKLGYVRRLRSILLAWNPDIIHSHNETGHFYASLANMLASMGGRRKAKLIHTKHGRGEPADGRSVIRNWLSSQLSDVVVAVSDDVAAVCRDVEYVPAARIHTIINGIGLDPYLGLNRKWADGGPDLGPEEGPVVFGHVGRLAAVKNQRMLIEAFARVHQQLPETRLVIAGEGPLREELEEQARSLRIATSVTFLGYRSDVPTVLAGIDIFLLSSVSEGTPLVVIEAMAAGCPVIATDVGGLAEMIEDQQSGMLVPSGDVASLAARMLDIAGDKERRSRLGKRGREIAEARYGLKRMVNEYCKLYEAMLDQGHGLREIPFQMPQR